VVRSSQDCKPIVNARLELWPEAPGGGHPDEFRATIFSDRQGQYQFECNPTDHIHMRISAPGFQTIFTNAYHPAAGQREGNFEIVLLGVS
jgi:protocatechuate 3,4-dioxygenase beta subunit